MGRRAAHDPRRHSRPAAAQKSSDGFPRAGSHLERCAKRFNAVEINSSFHKPHRRTTYERWTASVPAGFAFAVKAPREITHDLRLARAGAALDAFLAQASGLGSKLGVRLLQLPPRLACEPRHPTWFTSRTEDLLIRHHIARVAADPAVVPDAAEPGGWPGFSYFRLPGAPRIYWSAGADRAVRGQTGKIQGCRALVHSRQDCARRGDRNALALRGAIAR